MPIQAIENAIGTTKVAKYVRMLPGSSTASRETATDIDIYLWCS